MSRHSSKELAGGAPLLLLCLMTASIMEAGLVYHPKWYGLLYIMLPLLLLALLHYRRSH